MIAINSTNMMRTQNQWQQSNFQPIKVLYLLNKGIFEYLTVWLWLEAQLCPFQIIGMPPSIHIVMVQNHYQARPSCLLTKRSDTHTWCDRNNIIWVGPTTRKWYRSITPWESHLPKSDDILRERHISVSQPYRRTHWQSKLECLRGTLLKDLAGQ